MPTLLGQLASHPVCCPWYCVYDFAFIYMSCSFICFLFSYLIVNFYLYFGTSFPLAVSTIQINLESYKPLKLNKILKCFKNSYLFSFFWFHKISPTTVDKQPIHWQSLYQMFFASPKLYLCWKPGIWTRL